MNTCKRWLVLGALALGTVLSGSTALAGAFQVTPVTIAIDAQHPTATVTVRNDASEPVRLQVSAFAWTQSLDGQMVLGPTQDVVFFPSFVTLAPGEARAVRVGVTKATVGAERSYRLIVEELPPTVRPAVSNQIRVLTRMVLPIFAQASAPHPAPHIERLTATANRARFDLRNTGDAHFITRKVRFVARDAQGKTLMDESLPAWYMLAGGTRTYEVPLAQDVCARLATVEVQADTDVGSTRDQTSARCGP